MKIINITMLLFCAQVGIACSCGTTLLDLPIKEMGWTQTETEGISSLSDIIFTGELLDARKVEEISQTSLFYETRQVKYELIFKLIKSYKGDKNDTLKIRTNVGSEACGFGARKNTECLIFASKGNGGYYYTYSSECCKSISKAFEEKRYNKYIKFLESLSNMTDGNYIFYQSPSYYKGGYPDTTETMEVIRYNIKNGKLEGTWQIKDREGRVLEKGEYRDGQKIGTWEVISYVESDLRNADEQIRIEKIQFKHGQPRKSVTTIEDKAFVWEEPFHSQIIRKQKVIKKYKHFTMKK